MDTSPVYRPLVDLAAMEDRNIILTYRLDRAKITELCAQLEPDLEEETGDVPVAAVDHVDSEDEVAEDEDVDNRTPVIRQYFQ
ncbi:hypothetical protein NDU88_004843 [Pleurodeles waltl]|uniref:Uncharacterized protein n=1 Tax=Pleurodeles waltl TaxID=8319 RepID=A0AAV7VJV5_PLEWA|nr:hypothetical protein NDU88_004843 [Pleurodeles waltl]